MDELTSLGEQAKKKLADYVPRMERKLSDYWDGEVAKDFGFNQRQKELVREMLLHSKEHNLRPAKRARGAFVNYAYELSGQKADERVWKAAMAVEIVHTALLMHDDFMDKDDVRRGGPTTHKFFQEKAYGDLHYGESMAVDTGDAVLCLGFELLQDCGFEAEKVNEAMKKMLRGIAVTAYGQAYDVTLEIGKKWSEEDVINLHKAKTAVYTYENPLLIGAILGDVSAEAREVLVEYAMDGGVAFQIQDDILGVFGEEKETGKSSDSDLRQGKCTLLILKTLELGNGEQKAAVEKVWGKTGAGKRDLERAKKAINESGALEYNRELARSYAQKAVVTAEKLRGLKLEVEAIDYIQGIAEYLVTRKV